MWGAEGREGREGAWEPQGRGGGGECSSLQLAHTVHPPPPLPHFFSPLNPNYYFRTPTTSYPLSSYAPLLLTPSTPPLPLYPPIYPFCPSLPSLPLSPFCPILPHLASSGSTYDTWVSNAGPGGVPLTMKYYMTDLTNPVDVTYSGAKPEIRIKGPYVYRSLQETDVCV